MSSDLSLPQAQSLSASSRPNDESQERNQETKDTSSRQPSLTIDQLSTKSYILDMLEQMRGLSEASGLEPLTQGIDRLLNTCNDER